MKLFLATILLSITMNSAFATGGVNCTFARGENTLSSMDLSFGTAHIDGSPVITDIKLEGNGAVYRNDSMDIPLKRIVNYKNHKGDLFVLALDENIDQVVLELSYNFKTNKGRVTYKTEDGRTVSPRFIKCSNE